MAVLNLHFLSNCMQFLAERILTIMEKIALYVDCQIFMNFEGGFPNLFLKARVKELVSI